MDEKLRFVARLMEGEKMAVLCREFDISRKTGYKIFSREPDVGALSRRDSVARPAFPQKCREGRGYSRLPDPACSVWSRARGDLDLLSRFRRRLKLRCDDLQ
jgi:hypothetical protein